MKIPESKLGPLLLAGLVAAGAWLAAPARAQVTLRNLTVQSHLNEYPALGSGDYTTDYSACWSYVHSDGREYAVIGVGDGYGGGATEGTAIYNVTNPAGPYRVAFIPGPPSIWREMKQYRSWLYVVTEGTGPGEGVQIIRMTDPEHPVLVATYTGNFHRSHTVSVDTTRALLICNGTRWNAGDYSSYYFAGMRILSLANPEAPVEIGHWPAVMPATAEGCDTMYVHDSVPVGDRLYASSIVYGIERVFDFSDPANPVEQSEWSYAGAFSHNSWPDATGNWLYVTDERNGQPLEIFDISNLGAPVLFNQWTPNPAAMVHNVHVLGSDLYCSSYTEGIRLLDGSDPGHPAEWAYADTWPGPSGDFNGVWEVCPYFPSGTIIASDRTSGLWVFRAQRNYGLARIHVVNASNGQPMAGVHVFLDGGDSLATTRDGLAVFAPGPGSHGFSAQPFGYQPASATAGIVQGGTQGVTLALMPLPTVSFSGAIRSAASQAPLLDAELDLDYTPLHGHSDASGAFSLGQVPVGQYRVVVRSPGYVPVVFDRQIGPADAAMDFQLQPAPFYDALESPAGWATSAPDDDATPEGRWVSVDPVGTTVHDGGLGWGSLGSGAPTSRAFGGALPAHEGHRESEALSPGPVQPEDDRSPAGVRCFVTGQGSDTVAVDQADVDGGKTTLISPAYDLTGKSVPTIGYWRWFYTSTPQGPDYLAVSLSNDDGATWTPVETLDQADAHWEERAVRVADFVAPSTRVRLRFVAADGGGGSIVEAAIDDISVYDGAAVPLGATPELEAPARLRLRAPWPNPAAAAVRAVLELPRAGRVEARVIDTQGRVVARLMDRVVEAGSRVVEWDGREPSGKRARDGVYFLMARAGGAASRARFVLLH